MDSRLLESRVTLEYEVGDFSQGAAYLERLLEVMGLATPGLSTVYAIPAVLIPMIARITGTADRFEVAQATAETVLSSMYATPLYVMWARAGIALMAVHRGDVRAARDQYSILESQRGTMLGAGGMAVDRLLGLPAHTMGNLDQEMAHFEDALAFCRRAGYRPELAWACCDYADCLMQRSSPGDREKAVPLLDESLAISCELGMRPLMERVLARREILKA